MLVQNGVQGDSRVQKQAKSAADAGWDVLLLGRAPGRQEVTWKLGEAEVRLLPFRHQSTRAHEVRTPRLFAPLAYRFPAMARQRTQQVRVWRTQIGEIMARDAAADRTPAAATMRRLGLLPRRVAVKVAGTWIGLRAGETRRVANRRAKMTSRLDRLTTAFWLKTMGDRAWRRLDPALWDLEINFRAAIDEFEPDLIHANDFQMLGVGARAKLRALGKGRDVKLVWDAHEFLPGIRPWNPHPRWHPAQIGHESEYMPYADAVVTVSETLADLLRDRHGLRETPQVVMNAPDVDEVREEAAEPPSLREQCGIAPDTPLMVYSGGGALQRGLADMVRALPLLDGVHCAFVVSNLQSAFMAEVRALASELGVTDRLHLLPYVEYWQVVPYLSQADVGMIPIHHYLNHELALITKFFEYSHARLPIVVSEVETMSAMVRRTGQGEVCRAEDPEDLARAVTAVLDDPKTYRKAYEDGELLDRWTWKHQAERLHAVYRELLS
jgi:glycosyltransferase involved in cell wall biosynthesis